LRIAVIGAGAIGCLFGARLHLAGQSVLLIHHKKNVAASIAKNGVRIRELSGKVVRANIETRTRLSRSDNPDLILVTVKAYDTESVALILRATKLRNVPVLSLQNGLGNFETLDLRLGSDSIIAGTTSEGALTNGPGRVTHTGFGMTWLGEMKGGFSKRCQVIREAFRAAGFKTVITNNIKGVLWAKAIVNSAINPLTAIVHVRNGDLGNPELHEIALRVIDEGRAVALANGVVLEASSRRLFARILGSTARNKSSMLQDIEAGRRTEIRQLNGSISRLGRSIGVSTPFNELLTRLVLFLERPKG
jgi:2-dehydropantoate 2-reductase